MWQSAGLSAFIILGFMAKQGLMGLAPVRKTTGEQGEEGTVKPEVKRGAPGLSSPLAEGQRGAQQRWPGLASLQPGWDVGPGSGEQ